MRCKPGYKLWFLFCLLLPASAMALDEKVAQTILHLGEQQQLHSKILNEQRTILVSLPAGYDANSDIKYPVLVTLDARRQFQHVVGTMRWLSQSAGKVPPHIVVGIVNTKRFRDFSTSVPENFDNRYPENPPGGADKFIAFMSQELMPYLNKKYRTSGSRTLVGHSFGGLLALHVMLTKPQLFQGYIAMSPNVQYDQMELVQRAAKQLKPSGRLNAALFMSVGDEGPLKPGYEQLVKVLTEQAPQGLSWHSKVYLDEDHMSIPSRTLHNALMTIGEDLGWRLAPELTDQGLAAIKLHFAQLSQRFGLKITPPQQELNLLGYDLLEKEQVHQAVAVFRYNASAYPQSANVFDSLADALEVTGQRDAAKAALRTAISLAEKSQHADLAYFKQHLAKLNKK